MYTHTYLALFRKRVRSISQTCSFESDLSCECSCSSMYRIFALFRIISHVYLALFRIRVRSISQTCSFESDLSFVLSLWYRKQVKLG